MNRAISGADADTASEDAATEIPEGVTMPAGCGETEIGSAFGRVDELSKRSHVRNRTAGPDPCQLKPVHYLGDSRGRWEGDALVVETTNFHPKGNPMGGYFTLSDEHLRLVERFRRIADDTLEYTFTVDNPTMWTRPWTAVINWKRSRGELHEYACHEGNYSLRGMLSAARADEAGRR
jgi:hypothetical protein